MLILRLSGKAKDVFKMLEVLAHTEDYETDLNWWQIRLWLIRN